MNGENKSCSNRGGNDILQHPDIATEVLHISSMQSTHLLSPQRNAPQQVLCPLVSSDSCTSPVSRTSPPASVKPSNMGNVIVILSSLPGVVAGDEFWMKAASYLVTSKPAREFVACETICPELRIKWLRGEMENFKM